MKCYSLVHYDSRFVHSTKIWKVVENRKTENLFQDRMYQVGLHDLFPFLFKNTCIRRIIYVFDLVCFHYNLAWRLCLPLTFCEAKALLSLYCLRRWEISNCKSLQDASPDQKLCTPCRRNPVWNISLQFLSCQRTRKRRWSERWSTERTGGDRG